MKKIFVLLTFVMAVTVSFAQKGKVNTAQSYFNSGKLDKAKQFIDEGIQHPKCKEDKKAHFVKGMIYQAIYESPIPAYKKLDKNALDTAYIAYLKAIKLDEKGRYSKKIKNQFINLAIDYTNKAVKNYNEQNYAEALADFKRVLEIKNHEFLAEMNYPVDTPVIFNAGMAAQKSGKLEEAINFYKEALRYNYGEARPYAFIANSLKELGKKEESIKYLHKGYELYPDNEYMLVELINYYLYGGEPEKAEKYLDAAIQKNPENISYYRAKGHLFEKTEEYDRAIEMYKKVLDMDPKDFVSLYNLGMIKLNRLTEYHKKVNDIMDVDEYNKEIKKVFDQYKEVIPYFEKAHAVNPGEKNTVVYLKELYFRLRNEDKQYMDLYKKYKELSEKM